MRRTHVIAGLACLSGFCLAAGGCTRNAEAPPASKTRQGPASAGQGVVIEFQSEPDPPASGDNTFEVVVTQPDGSPVTDATVEAVFSMPAMPSMNMPAMRSTTALAHQGSGRYRGTGQLSMSGTWNVIVMVSRGAEELGRRNLSVIAR
jgi:YtkA-like protein